MITNPYLILAGFGLFLVAIAHPKLIGKLVTWLALLVPRACWRLTFGRK